MTENLESLGSKLLLAAVNCSHTITEECVKLSFESGKPGHNALDQLSLRLEAFLATLGVGAPSMRWLPIETAPKDGRIILVNDTNDGASPWVAAKWLSSEGWEGWIYDDEVMSDTLPLGPKPTRWLEGLDEAACEISETDGPAGDCTRTQAPSSARSRMAPAMGSDFLQRPLTETLDPPAAVPAPVDMPGQADDAARPPARKPPHLHPRTADLVDRFAEALASKLALAEQKHGYSDGWATEDWMPQCRQGLLAHISKGDPLDVGAYAAFLWHHGATAAPWPAERTSQEERIEALFARIQRLGERFGALWDRHQGKGWSDEASDEFEKIRDVKLPAAKAELRVLLAEAQQQPPAA